MKKKDWDDVYAFSATRLITVARDVYHRLAGPSRGLVRFGNVFDSRVCCAVQRKGVIFLWISLSKEREGFY